MRAVSGLPTPASTAVSDWCFCGPVGSTDWAAWSALALLVPALLIGGRAVWDSRRRQQVGHHPDDGKRQSPPPAMHSRRCGNGRRGPNRPGVLSLLGLMMFAVTCSPFGPAHVPLAELADQEEAYIGETVQTTGTVRMFEAEGRFARHFVLEDEQRNRVAIVPQDALADFVGERIEVTGRFEFDEATGRVIHLDSVTGAGSG